MENFVIRNPSGLDLEFEGQRLFRYTGSGLNTLEIYETRAGKIIAFRRERRSMAQRVHREEARVFEDLDAMLDWLGYSDEAKRAAEALGRPLRQRIP